MKYNEEIRDLFTVPDEYYLAHCISADFALGAGIAKEFNKRFDMRNKLRSKNPDYINIYDACIYHYKTQGHCILIDRVYNLVTKRNFWNKPTYESLRDSLVYMKMLAVKDGITKIAMPQIGSGLDRLQWEKVSEIIKDVFTDTDIEILVCKLK